MARKDKPRALHMTNAEALQLIKKLPDDVSTGTIMEELFFKQQVERGLKDIADGRIPPPQRPERKNRAMAQVRWLLTAGNDLQGIEDFITRDSVLHAVAIASPPSAGLTHRKSL